MDFPLPGVGYTITLDDNGLSKLSLGGDTLGNGIVQLIDGSWFYRPFDPLGKVPTVASKTVEFQPNGAIVTHVYTGLLGAKVVYTYTVSGNDVHISALVFNTGTKPLQPGFSSMNFQRAPGGTYLNLGFDQSSTQSNPDIYYPGFNVPYAAAAWLGVPSTAPGAPQINLASWSEEDPYEKFMQLLYTHALPGVSQASIFFSIVPPGGSRVYKWAYRFQNSTDWKDLLGGYKTALRTVFPTLSYEPDARPILQFARTDVSFIRPDNPYGYQDGGTNLSSRFDKLEGCQDYLTRTLPPMTQVGYQGVIFWQLQGEHPRGVKYRPDFNVYPPETIPNLPVLTSGFRNAGFSIGLLSRPSVTITSATWTTDGLASLTDEPNSVLDLKARLQWALGQTFNSFYLDSFVNDDTDHGILKTIRDTVGPNVHLFCEHSTALSMALSAAYLEISWTNGVVLPQKIEVLRWLWPESIIAGKFVGNIASVPGGYAQLYTAMFDQKISVLEQDFIVHLNLNGSNTALQPLVASRIGPDRRWL